MYVEFISSQLFSQQTCVYWKKNETNKNSDFIRSSDELNYSYGVTLAIMKLLYYYTSRCLKKITIFYFIL